MRPGDNRSFGARVSFGGRSDRGTGYMAYSDRVGPGVLIVHDSHGLGPALLALADEFNDEGFTVLCPDIHGRDERRARARLAAAAAHLTDNWHPRLGIVGFSAGAELAAALAPEVDPSALILYYGLGDALGPAPVQGHFGELDAEVPAARAARLFEDAPDAELHVYRGAGHGFANPEAPAYDPAAADLARRRTLDFLRHHLS